MSIQSKKQEIIKQIRNLFGDTSVPASATKEALEEISEEIAGLIETLSLGED